MKQKAPSASTPGQIGDHDLRLLRVFLAVVRCGGVTAAELELNVGRSTISRQLRDLEIRLGATLCQRGRSGFRLTAEGDKVCAAARQLFSAVDGFRMEVSELREQLHGRLRLAVFDKTVTNPAARITDTIRRFDDVAPAVRLEVHVEPTNLIESGVMDGTFDVGIIPTHRDSPSLRYHNLFTERMVLYCGRAHPCFGLPEDAITLERIRADRYAGIGFHSPNMMHALSLGLERHADVFDQEGAAMMILSGRYLGFLPDHYARRFEDQGLLRPLRPERFGYHCDFAAIHRRSPAPSVPVRRFIECLVESHAEAAGEGAQAVTAAGCRVSRSSPDTRTGRG